MLQTIPALLIFLFPLAYSPGPGNMFFAANGARFGFRATLPANFGYHIATWVVTAAIGLGFLAALDTAPQVFGILRIAGALYVFWIAYGLIRSGTMAGGPDPKPARFTDGVVLLILNPKAYVIIALMFTQFLRPPQANPLTATLLIATVFTLNNLAAFLIWTLIGDRIARHFRSPESARRRGLFFGLILASVAMWMLLA